MDDRVNRALPANGDLGKYWSENGASLWISLQGPLESLMAPMVDPALAAMAARPGESLLDVGCGCGQRAIDLAYQVGPTGAILGVDVSAPMLSVARQLAETAGAPHCRFVEADAQTYPLAAASFDGIFSFFGLMFFEDPATAFRNFAQALKPGGRLAFACWRSRDQNEWSTIPLAAALRQVPRSTSPAPNKPGAYSLSHRQEIEQLLEGAGFTDTGIRPLDLTTGFRTFDDALAYTRAGPVSTFAERYPEHSEAIDLALQQALRERLTPAGIFLKSTIWIVDSRRI